MTYLSILPEPYPERGGSPANKIREAKKVGGVKEIELLFREAVQNSNDQRINVDSAIKFTMSILELSSSQKALLANAINKYDFKRSVKKIAFLRDLKKKLKEEKSYSLIIADSGTKGLNGPISASVSSEENNFANFFFKVGRAGSASDSAGGNKGEGRGVFFLNSQIGTALVFSRFYDSKNGVIKSRFFGMTLDEDFEEDGVAYSGHWYWGKKNKQGKSEPFQELEATTLAREFNLESHLIETTGTVIAVLLPRYISDEASARLYVENLRFAAEKIAWPHLIPDEKGKRSIDLRIFHPDGSETIPDPLKRQSAAFKYAKLYQQNFLELKSSTKQITLDFKTSFSKDGKDYELEKGEVLGNLYWSKELIDTALTKKSRILEEESTGLDNYPEYLTGIALFRSPKMIVQYLKTSLNSHELELFGYFASSNKANVFFRESEEGSHDEWIYKKLQLALGRARPNPVRRLQAVIEEVAKSIQKEILDSRGDGLDVDLMYEFSTMLDFEGTSSTRPIPEPPLDPQPPRPSIQTPLISWMNREPELVSSEDGFLFGSFDFSIEYDPALMTKSHASIAFIPQIVTADGLENVSDHQLPGEPEIAEIVFDGIDLPSQVKILTKSDAHQVLNAKVIVKFEGNVQISCAVKVRYFDEHEKSGEEIV